MLFYLNPQKNLRNLLIIKMTDKSENAYKTIGEVAEILELKSKKEGVFSTHTIRFWETQFKQIKPLSRVRPRLDRPATDPSGG